MEFQLSYFRSWKMMLWKCYTQYASKFGKLSSGHRTKKGLFISIPKKGNPKECSNYCTIALISHAIKVMLIILQAMLQHYMNDELPDVQAGFRKGRRTRDQIANICWIIEKARKFQKNIYFCLIDYIKDFDYVNHNKLDKSSKDRNTSLLRNMYAVQEATVGTRHGTDWFPVGKGVCQGCILSHCLFTSMQSISCKMPDCIKHTLESRFLGEITSIYADGPTLMAEAKKN